MAVQVFMRLFVPLNESHEPRQAAGLDNTLGMMGRLRHLSFLHLWPKDSNFFALSCSINLLH